jgi:hypothetical protein
MTHSSPGARRDRCRDVRHGSKQNQRIILGWDKSTPAPERRSIIVQCIHDKRAAADQLRTID